MRSIPLVRGGVLDFGSGSFVRKTARLEHLPNPSPWFDPFVDAKPFEVPVGVSERRVTVPQVFRGDQLRIEPMCKGVVITSIRIGNDEQLAVDEVPTFMFMGNPHISLTLPTAAKDSTVVIKLRNDGKVTQELRMWLEGCYVA